jgi:AcrR family transcriptional regulator
MSDTTDPGAGDGTDRPPRTMTVPASVLAAWGQQPRAARGPRPALSLERIVQAAVAVADAEGLDAVSMGRVAKELGASPMALYRYVGAKTELLALMVDTAMGPPDAPPAGADWRARLTDWGLQALTCYLRQPWIVRVPIPAPPVTPNQVRWMEAGLAALRGTGLTDREKLSAILLVSGLARYWAGLAADVGDAVRATGLDDPSAGYGQALLQLVDSAEFPEVTKAVASGALDDDDEEDFVPGDEMRFALDRVLDGIEVLVRRRGGPAD